MNKKVRTYKPVNVTPVRLRRSRVVDTACKEVSARLLNTKIGKPGISPSWLATKSGVSTTTLYRLRDNGRRPYSPHLKTVEFALKPLGFELTFVKKEHS